MRMKEVMKMPKDIKFGDMVAYYMRLNNLTMKELGEKVGRGESTVSMWISNKSTPPMGIVQKLADLFGVTTDEMIYGQEKNIDSQINQKSMQRIPLYTSISCGTGLFVDDQIEDYIAIPDKYIKPGHDYFANTASGDSMIGKGIKEGDVLVFEKTNVIENGEIGAFCVGESEAVCKVFRKLPSGMILLESANEAYQPIEVDLTDECFRVIGKYKFKFSVEQ